MKNIKIVIGANFGDEGKGLMTDYFSNQFGDGLVVRFNGGSQAGHTVVTPEGIRHVFSHFGSGAFSGMDTYLSRFFIINPFIFKKEYGELAKKGIDPLVYADLDCMVTTPYDMIINQIAEEHRNLNRHGSCGLGINETIKRSSVCPLRLFDIFYYQRRALDCLEHIRQDYTYSRLKDLGIESIPTKYVELLSSDILKANYIRDIEFMFKNIQILEPERKTINLYDNIIFEGSQGLLLDQNNREYFPNLTPSNTGMQNVNLLLHLLDDTQPKEIEICYVSRNYMTRHGAGKFETEMANKPYERVMDLTNVPNPYQGGLRFGSLDIDLLKKSITKDLKFITDLNYKKSLAITCLDQIGDNDKFKYAQDGWEHSIESKDVIEFFRSQFEDFNLYFSYGMSRDTIKQ